MANFLKYLAATVAVAAGITIGYGVKELHQERLSKAFESGNKIGIQQGIDETVNEIKTKSLDFNNDGLEDFCVTIPASPSSPNQKIICRYDFDGDCIQDTVYGMVDDEGETSIVDIKIGKKLEGKCEKKCKTWADL